MKKAKIKPIFERIRLGRSRLPLMSLIAAVGLVWGSCGPTQHLPSNPVGKDSTAVHYIDSVRWNIIDSVRITERSRYKDFTGLLDTLKIDDEAGRASMRAWNDTTKGILSGSLKVEPTKEKTKIVYREKIQYRDSIKIKEVPVPYEVEKKVKYIPWIYKVLSVIGLIWIVILLIKLIVKIKTMGILK